jgi:Reverse transcriptase (RNA-dependent DNA polymerase)
VKAAQDSAESAVKINGRLAKFFKIRQSVRQGCPLSPLLFVLAMDALSLMLQDSLDKGTLQGVKFPRIGIHNAHTLYADDVSLVITALFRFLKKIVELFYWFGLASGLYCKWNGTRAAMIPAQVPPAAFSHLDWTWESPTDASKLLGVPFAQGISDMGMIH